MCLYTHQLSKFTAEDDIVCYKLLEKHTFYTVSICQRFKYWRFKLYQTMFKIYGYSIVNVCCEGFHSFQTIDAAVKYYIDNHCTSLKEKVCLYKCVIPKGAQYVKGDSTNILFAHHIDDSRQYCSNKIIIKHSIQNEFNKLIKELNDKK